MLVWFADFVLIWWFWINLLHFIFNLAGLFVSFIQEFAVVVDSVVIEVIVVEVEIVVMEIIWLTLN